MERIRFTLAVEKADDYGYQALLKMGDHERSACRTSLAEILDWFNRHAGSICRETPYQAPAAPVAQPEAIEPFPSIVADMERERVSDPDPRLTEELMETVRRHGRNGQPLGGLAVVAWLGMLWLSTRMSGMV